MLTPQLTPRPYRYPQHIGLLWVNRFRTKWFPPASLDSAPSCCEELGTRGRALLPPRPSAAPRPRGPHAPTWGEPGLGAERSVAVPGGGSSGRGGFVKANSGFPGDTSSGLHGEPGLSAAVQDLAHRPFSIKHKHPAKRGSTRG